MLLLPERTKKTAERSVDFFTHSVLHKKKIRARCDDDAAAAVVWWYTRLHRRRTRTERARFKTPPRKYIEPVTVVVVVVVVAAVTGHRGHRPSRRPPRAAQSRERTAALVGLLGGQALCARARRGAALPGGQSHRSRVHPPVRAAAAAVARSDAFKEKTPAGATRKRKTFVCSGRKTISRHTTWFAIIIPEMIRAISRLKYKV